MGAQFQRIADTGALESLFSNSNDRPIVIFKHSNSCSISAAAYREMQQLQSEVVLVEVQTARDLSRELAERTGIRHESPQVIVLRNGKAVWNASHFAVSASEVSRILQVHENDSGVLDG